MDLAANRQIKQDFGSSTKLSQQESNDSTPSSDYFGFFIIYKKHNDVLSTSLSYLQSWKSQQNKDEHNQPKHN